MTAYIRFCSSQLSAAALLQKLVGQGPGARTGVSGVRIPYFQGSDVGLRSEVLELGNLNSAECPGVGPGDGGGPGGDQAGVRRGGAAVPGAPARAGHAPLLLPPQARQARHRVPAVSGEAGQGHLPLPPRLLLPPGASPQGELLTTLLPPPPPPLPLPTPPASRRRSPGPEPSASRWISRSVSSGVCSFVGIIFAPWLR